METALSEDVVWCLRALAQEASVQRALYPSFAVVADELVLDFDDAYSGYKQTHQTQHDDLESLDALIESKSGILEYWTSEALEQSEFWREIRRRATDALKARSLTTDAPSPSSNLFVSEQETWISGRTKHRQPNDRPSSFITKLLKLFR